MSVSLIQGVKGAYAGKLLHVDLTAGVVKPEPLNMSWAREFIGGKGLAARYLFELLRPGTDPLSPDNVLIWMTGPLTGTVASTMSRVALVTKSPLSNTFLDSYAGGFFPAELKFAGFDGIIIQGRAATPRYILIREGEAEVKDASPLWGKNTHEATDILERELGDKKIRVGTIGPAGEHLVRFANVAFDRHHFAGRGGAGAVMASKNLKAVVARGIGGPKTVSVNSDQKFLSLVREVIKTDIHENPDEEWAIKEGTPFVVDRSQENGLLPTRNFQTGVFDKADDIDFSAIKEKTLDKHTTTCFSCSIGCRNVTSIKDGKFKGLRGEGPEYETLSMCGSNCGIGDLLTITRFNQLCSQNGMDTISTGNTVAFAMELYELGILSSEEVGGLDLRFGNEEAYLAMPDLIANRRGIGDTLAEGTRIAAQRIGRGSDRYSLNVKGLEYPGYDPRGSYGMGLAYATSDRGACHMRAWPVAFEAFGKRDPFTTEGKAKLVADEHYLKAVRWSLTACDFYAVGYAYMAKLASHAIGTNITEDELRRIGKRIWTLTRAFNVREGFTRNDDTLAPRIYLDPLPDGRPKGKILSKENLEKMLTEYYALVGWDENGIPKKEMLAELNLAEEVEEIRKAVAEMKSGAGLLD
ncbi:MAG: aldehyde ferredoxin oxidoreductase family protein [Candidatus Bathyarchaeia archaeon]